jgi:hypothetical protein
MNVVVIGAERIVPRFGAFVEVVSGMKGGSVCPGELRDTGKKNGRIAGRFLAKGEKGMAKQSKGAGTCFLEDRYIFQFILSREQRVLA